MSNLSINNVINVSVSQVGAGIGQYNTSNIALFSHEAYETSFGTDGYKLYLSPTDVETDFGSASVTYKQALAVFSQQPNMLAGGGYLVIIPVMTETQTVAFDLTPDAGDFTLSYDGVDSSPINWDDTAAQIQVSLRMIAGLEDIIVTGAIDSITGLTVDMQGVPGDPLPLVSSANSLVDGATAVVITVTENEESLGEAITRTSDLIEYFGIISTYIQAEAELLAAAAVVQAESKIVFFVQTNVLTLEVGGTLDLLRQGSFTHSRGLFYGSLLEADALNFMAAYASRGLSTNFDGSLTTQTMHLKSLATVVADTSMDQTKLNKAENAGADVYISIQGVAKTFTSGENDFFDNVYNLLWFVGDLKVAAFNVLAQNATKIAQTEEGIGIIKSSLRAVCEQGVTNNYLAPGTWTSPTTFGVQGDFFDNIDQRGYYIYSQPIGLQSPADRSDRKAPLIQIAAKQAGAVHSIDIIVNINE